MTDILWCSLFFVIGFALGVRAAVAVVNYQTRRGLMFYYRGGQWVGNAEAIKRDIAARMLKARAKHE